MTDETMATVAPTFEALAPTRKKCRPREPLPVLKKITPIRVKKLQRRGRPAVVAKGTQTLGVREREQVTLAASALIAGFMWASTREGFEFWRSVHRRLRGLGEGEPLT